MAVLDEVSVVPGPHYDPDAWYFGIPAIARLRDAPLRLAPATVVVGENGSGKSTFVEAVATAWHTRRLTGAQVKHWSPRVSDEDADLHWHLGLAGERPPPQGGCFLRAEAMHDLFVHLDSDGTQVRAFGGELNVRSHGEGFLAFLESRTTERGLFVLDEPEAALSFTSCLRLLSLLDLLLRGGSQVLLATHSPLLAALPGAQILEFDAEGITPTGWDDLELVQHWRAFLDRPTLYLRHLFAD